MLLTIILFLIGLIASYYIARWQMKKNKIVHFLINSYDIGKGLSDVFPDFKLHFGDEVLSDNVMVLKGGFMNVGRNDITGFKGEKDIKLILPNECKVKAITIQPSTDGLDVNSYKDNEKENILNFGISEVFKTDEFFKYTAIVETSDEIDENIIRFQHRIINTDKIENISIGKENKPIRKKRFFYSVAFVIYLCILQFSLSLYPGVEYNIYEKGTNKEVSVRIDPSSNIHISDGINLPFITDSVISCKEFKNNYKIETNTEFKWFNAITFVTIIEILLFASILFWLYYIAWGKYSHITNVITKNDSINKKQI